MRAFRGSESFFGRTAPIQMEKTFFFFSGFPWPGGPFGAPWPARRESRQDLGPRPPKPYQPRGPALEFAPRSFLTVWDRPVFINRGAECPAGVGRSEFGEKNPFLPNNSNPGDLSGRSLKFFLIRKLRSWGEPQAPGPGDRAPPIGGRSEIRAAGPNQIRAKGLGCFGAAAKGSCMMPRPVSPPRGRAIPHSGPPPPPAEPASFSPKIFFLDLENSAGFFLPDKPGTGKPAPPPPGLTTNPSPPNLFF